MRTLIIALLIALSTLLVVSCGSRSNASKPAASGQATENAAPKVTFVELGSVSCIPCKKMQPIMKSIETRYVGQVKVVFYDVLKDRAPATQYGIKLIPTQVFLDANGKEIARHEGFFPEEDIDKILAAQGLSPTY